MPVKNILFLCAACFCAAVVDAIAGGGGIISLPAYFLAGIPPYAALGTNKFSSSIGTTMSTYQFIKSGKVNFDIVKFLIPFTLIGSALGVTTILKVNEKYLQTAVLIMILFVGVYSLFSKTKGIKDNFTGATKLNLFLGIILAFALGFYDGFFGPGTGSFLIFGLINIYGFDYIKAGGNAKILNLASNISALALFAIHGQINYLVGIPCAFTMIFGARLGAKLALKNGVKIIKPIFITMSLAVAVKMLIAIF
ncbi:MAG: TSUP family transporter [Bacillota bacterium]|nr:TSUP family transporter [Bacillota bacterium]